MQPQSSVSPVQPQRLRAARRALKAATTKPAGQGTALQLPRNVSADAAFITAANNYRQCAKRYMAHWADWQNFSATHPHEDAGHAEHHRRVMASRLALNGADAAYVAATAVLLGPEFAS